MSDNESRAARADTSRKVVPLHHQDLQATVRARRHMPWLRRLWLLTLVLAVACAVASALFGGAEVDASGMLHEPLFGLIPIGFALLLIALLLAIVGGVLNLAARRR